MEISYRNNSSRLDF